MNPQPLYPWYLSQDRLDLLTQTLYKAETLINVAAPSTAGAANIGRLITDLRAQCCERGGAADPWPDMPMFPAFPDTVIAAPPLWVDQVAEKEVA